jgi:hypothetical protein
MSDLTDQYQDALDKATEAELLGGLCTERGKRGYYRQQAAFHYSIAEQLRLKLASLPKCREMAEG